MLRRPTGTRPGPARSISLADGGAAANFCAANRDFAKCPFYHILLVKTSLHSQDPKRTLFSRARSLLPPPLPPLQLPDLSRYDAFSWLGANVDGGKLSVSSAAWAATWPAVARAQQDVGMRRIGVLMNFAEDDLEGQSRVAAFSQALETFGWTVGRNLQIDVRWGAADAESHRRSTAELVALAPDVMLASAESSRDGDTADGLRRTGRVCRRVRPRRSGIRRQSGAAGWQIDRFYPFEYGLSAKWLELLKELVPRVSRVAVLRNPAIASGPGQLGALQAAASSLGVELRQIDVRNADELERALNSFVRGTNDGLIATGGGSAVQRKLIVALAARHRLPAIYPYRYFVADGGLMSYGPDLVDQYRQAADYVSRILQGEKPAALAVQASTRYRLIINLKTAKAIGITVPISLLSRADEVIE